MSKPKALTTEARLQRVERGLVALGEVLALTEKINGRRLEEIGARLQGLRQELDELKDEPASEVGPVKSERVH